jgi:NADH-quinone oxidoreductase subunit C
MDPLTETSPVPAERLLEVARSLRDGPSTRFDYLRCIAAVDYGEEFELVYLLFSYIHRRDFKLKVRVPRARPEVPSIESVWPAAAWHEREAFDLMGIRFPGNSDLRRLFLPEDWVGHPLRKDYQEPAEYAGISTKREYPTEGT